VNIESYVEFGCNEYFVVFGTDIVSNEPNDFREAESSKTEADFSKKQRLVLCVVQPWFCVLTITLRLFMQLTGSCHGSHNV